MLKHIFHFGIRIIMAGYILILMAITVPGLLGIRIETVTSGSMEPMIPVGSVVYVKAAGFEQIETGDVITYFLDENLTKVTHRVVEKIENSRRFVTKGDANEGKDPKEVLIENVEGKVIFHVPLLGRIAILLTYLYGKILLLSILLFLSLIDWGIEQWIHKKAGVKEASCV